MDLDSDFVELGFGFGSEIGMCIRVLISGDELVLGCFLGFVFRIDIYVRNLDIVLDLGLFHLDIGCSVWTGIWFRVFGMEVYLDSMRSL